MIERKDVADYHRQINPFAAKNSKKKISGKRIPGTAKFLACCFQPRKGQAMRLDRYLRYQIKALLDAGHSQKNVACLPPFVGMWGEREHELADTAISAERGVL